MVVYEKQETRPKFEPPVKKEAKKGLSIDGDEGREGGWKAAMIFRGV